MKTPKIKTVGFLSTKTGKIYKTSSARKGAETRLANAEYKDKLEALKQKFHG